MVNVTVYIKENDPPSKEVLNIIDQLGKELSFEKETIDISSNPSLFEKYNNVAPLVVVGPYQLSTPISRKDLWTTISAAINQQEKLQVTGNHHQEKVKRDNEITRADRLTLWLGNYYIYILNLIIFIYVGLPFLAPILAKSNFDGPAKLIYTMYSPVCHQLAYRSWFLFGEQPYYPRALAQVAGAKTYEAVTGIDPANLQAGRDFIGNQTLGFKVAFCERDVAIYAAMLLFGIIFMVTGRKIKAIPWYVWVGIGMVPMGIDGGLQLFNFAQGFLPAWVPLWESTPILRTLTGAIFGIATSWYVLPIIEESMLESRSFILRKVAVIKSKTNQN